MVRVAIPYYHLVAKNNLVGHYDSYVSDYAARNLMKELDDRISVEIAKNPGTLDDTIPVCLVDTIEGFDATLHRTLIERMRAVDSKPWNEWTMDDIPRFLGMKELGEHDPYPVMKRSCSGSTALVAVIISKRSDAGEQSMWVASLGDCEGSESFILFDGARGNLGPMADLGRIINNLWTTTSLNDLHNLENPAEVQRLQAEHPGEDDLIKNGGTKGQLRITRGKHAMVM
jgi:pyruvate dehydrogenase phosphatase